MQILQIVQASKQGCFQGQGLGKRHVFFVQNPILQLSFLGDSDFGFQRRNLKKKTYMDESFGVDPSTLRTLQALSKVVKNASPLAKSKQVNIEKSAK